MVEQSQELLEKLRQLKNSDEEKFIEFLFKLFYAPLCKAVYNIVFDRDAAEDIVQDVFVKVWHKRDRLDLSQSVKAYLYRSAFNTALNYLEKNKKKVMLDDVLLSRTNQSSNLTEESLNYQEIEQKISEAIAQLPPRCRAVFTMSRFEEMSYQEIAQTLGISVKAVEKQISKALQQLRKRLRVYIKHLISFLFLFFNIF